MNSFGRVINSFFKFIWESIKMVFKFIKTIFVKFWKVILTIFVLFFSLFTFKKIKHKGEKIECEKN